MAYYTQEDLEAISIHKYDNLLIKKLGIADVDDIVDEDGEAFPYDDADDFLQGACQLFAYALKEAFEYKVYKIQSGTSFHIFCKSDDGRVYIDVRGKTVSFKEFVQGLFSIKTEIDNSEEYKFIESDFNQPFYDVGLMFAEAIIQDDLERYAL